MKKTVLFCATLVALCLIGTLVVRFSMGTLGIAKPDANSGEFRIVTMAPSSGEVVFALGLADQVVGVSRFATFPQEVHDKPKVGGYLDVDMEALLGLNANVVVVLKEQEDLARRLRQFGIDVVMVDHMSIAGIKDSVQLLGQKFNKPKEASLLLSSLQDRIQMVESLSDSQNAKPSMLLSIGRELGKGKVSGLVAAGAAGIHQELLEIAGYSNSYKGRENFPQLTREHIIRMDPEFIVDMVNAEDATHIGVDVIRSDWESHQELRAVREGLVFVLAGDQHFVPGPRFCDTLEWLITLRRGVEK